MDLEHKPTKLSLPISELGPRNPHAFCLVRYITQDEKRIETFWNSRDGLTPHHVTLELLGRSGVVAFRDDSQGVVYAPDHVPNIGDGMFVDFTKRSARAAAAAHVRTSWDHIMSDLYGASRRKAIDYYADLWYRSSGANIVYVDSRIQRTIYDSQRRKHCADTRDGSNPS